MTPTRASCTPPTPRRPGKTVQAVKIPASQNVLAVYPIAPIAATQNASLANGWIKYVTSAAGQKTLKSFGFLPPPPVE